MFIKRSYEKAEQRYGALINDKISDDTLMMITYAIIIYEDYCRPPSARLVERLCFWKKERTTVIMQVASPTALSDEESVRRGTDKLIAAWQRHTEEPLYSRMHMTITDYN